ncbi:MAG: CHAT domain-containing protein [Coleofasciculus sp. B1-GNL1-01]|uniref:CHAT domain-containing protein n=1 Tax=Coleofasciculus sp. B1-GNL1-01 TaxID=3068484 RepID=UPI0032F696EF
MTTAISLVITTYNRENYLGAAIDSILAQTWGDFELIVWDDGSTDQSVTIAQDYAKRDPRVRVVAAEHQGRGISLKRAIAQTTGSYIGWVDSDDRLAPTALAETAAILDTQPEVGMVYTDYQVINKSGNVTGYGSRCRIPFSKEGMLQKFMTFHFRLIRRSVYDKVGGIDELFYYVEDYDLSLRLSELTDVYHLKKPLYYYRNHSDSICYQHSIEQRLQARKAVAWAIARRSSINRSGLSSKPACIRPIRKVLKQIVSFAALPLIAAINFMPAQAQITPSADGTGTQVTPIGDQIDIAGGTLSGDGANLFHSFSQFGLDSEQIANFISQPSIQNILGRVNGGYPSIINGLVQVTGGNSNLFLMNPSGIVFGANASLNVPADFTATTATGIGFDGGWFNAVGSTNYINLVGNPSAFEFATSQPGSIVNAGNLAVSEGQTLSLVGGNVINTGTMEATGGTITIAAVPGTSRLRLTQTGQVLSLEVSTNNPNAITPLMLPELLTGSNQETGLTVNEDNTVQTTAGTVIPQQPGTAIVSGTVDASADSVGGNVDVFGTVVGLVDQAQINVSGDTGGGEIRVGGEYKGQGTIPTADTTVVGNQVTINADARVNGNGGRVIIWSDDFTRFSGTITARGGPESGNGGFVETSGKNLLESIGGSVDASAANGLPGSWLLDPRNVTITDMDTSDGTFIDGTFTPTADGAIINVADIEAALDLGTSVTITTGDTGNQEGNITLAADLSSFSFSERNLTLDAANDIFINAEIFSADGEGGEPLNVFLLANGNIEVNNNIITAGGTIELTSSSGFIDSTGGTLNSSSADSNGGAITLNAPTGITTGEINSSSTWAGSGSPTGGAVNLTSDGDIVTAAINSFFEGDNFYGSEGGAVNLEAGGNIQTGEINSSSINTARFSSENSQGGAVELVASGTITTDGINTSGSSDGELNSIGGSVTIEAGSDIDVTGIIDSSTSSSAFAIEGSATAGSATGGLVSLNSATGSINTNTINSSALSSAFSSAGVVTSSFATGGEVNFNATEAIQTGSIDTTASSFASDETGTATGNSVTLEGSSIVFESIDTSAFSDLADGIGGNVSITANGIPDGLVRGVGTISETDITIKTEGNTESGIVDITHNGGIDNELFTVGDASINGTAGGINAGESSTILPDQEIPSPGTLIPETITSSQGNINITFVNQSPSLTADVLLPTTETNESITFTLSDLDIEVADENGDNTIIQISEITAGTLTLEDGTPVTSETELSVDDVLVYTPPIDETGDIAAFTIVGSDRVSFSEPQQVSVNVELPSDDGMSDDDMSDDGILESSARLTAILLQNEVEEKIESFPVVQPIASNRVSTPIKSETEARQILSEIEQATGEKPALIYVSFAPTEISKNTNYIGLETNNTEAFDNYLNRSGPHVTITPQESDQLELLIISAEEPPIRRRIAGVTRGQVLEVAQEFRRNVTNVRIPRDYITPGQQLYQWLVAPLEENLQTQEIDNLAFIMDEGLRSLPVAALHDGEGFLIERYSVGLMPSLSLTDTRYVDIRDVGVLAMGAETFEDLNPLPAVPLELSAIAGPLWQGKAFLNQEFTLENIKEIRSSQPFGIVHLATHGEFKSGQPSNSYIQLWNQKLRLDQLRQLGLNNPPTELLILSACRTALGDREAELGFAGLAIQAGVKSALGSLWYVSDTGTLGFMTSFYDHLQQAPIKAEALRQTQLAMLNGEVRLEDKQLIAGDIQIPLNPELAQTPDQDFTHPYYWSALTLVGSPW